VGHIDNSLLTHSRGTAWSWGCDRSAVLSTTRLRMSKQL